MVAFVYVDILWLTSLLFVRNSDLKGPTQKYVQLDLYLV